MSVTFIDSKQTTAKMTEPTNQDQFVQMTPKCNPLRLVVARRNAEQHGAPNASRCVTQSCWVSAALVILANDPFIAMFVNFVCYDNGGVASLSDVTQDWDTVVASDTLQFDANFTRTLIKTIWLVNNGTHQKVKDSSATLYVATLAIQDAEKVAHNDGYGDAVIDALWKFHRCILNAMKAHWNQQFWDMYEVYGFRIHTCRIHSAQSAISAKEKQTNCIEQEVTSIDVCPDADGIDSLEYFINRVHFNNCIATDFKMDGNKTNSTLHIRGFPWRFSVKVIRLLFNERTGKQELNNGCVNYNPAALVIGPSMTTGEWCRYRLVGRIAFKSQHYTSVVINPEYQLQADSGSIAKYTKYDFEVRTEFTFDLTADGSYNDTECCLLEFEQYK